MANNLEKYWTKRNFGITAEPKGAVKPSGKALTFVIQKHAASRLHYDFRLELDGTLKSWAVPKGPSLDPADKRMAVHVEDHPLEYATFEGVIPKGQYGAGTVIVWDRGVWIPINDALEGYRQGKLKFELQGEKLNGHWTLVRMRGRGTERQEPWLLIKERDETARPAAEFDITEAMPDSVNAPDAAVSSPRSAGKKTVARKIGVKKTPALFAQPSLPTGAHTAKLPFSLAPQLATLASAAPTTGDWIYEIKFDGYRIVARVDGTDIRLFTRNGHDWTSKLKHLALAIAALELPGGWLDGEIVVPSGDGRTSFQSLQNAFDTAATQDIHYYLFDLPYFAGHDLREVPLRERRNLLQQVLSTNTSSHLKFSEEFEADAGSLLEAACDLRLEGVIGKRADAPYTSTRSSSWIKLKCTQRQEFVIGGYTDPRGSRTGLGSLLLGVHDAQGQLIYAGNVGTGFDEKTLNALKRKLSALETKQAPFHQLPTGVKGHWVKPKLVAEVSFGEWTSEGRIRHSVFHGLRTDKPPGNITKETVIAPPSKSAAQTPSAPGPPSKVSVKKSAKGPGVTLSAGVKISHGERVVDETTGLTKLDLVRYYESIAKYMLPHLKGRPTSLVRGPSGIKGQLFFQKHVDTMRIPGVNELDPAFLPGHPPMLEVATAQALVQAAQLNVIEFHTWNATVKSIENPDRLLFDLDPGEGVEWQQIVEGTMLTKAFLDELKLKSFLKTSGGKGLHVIVPLTASLGWDEVKDFSEAVVVHLARTVPQRFVAKSGPSNRVGRIFIDYLRNGRGATTAAAFSARARPGLGVSVPLAWSELEGLKSASEWNITSTLARLTKLSSDPWADYKGSRQTTKRAAQLLRGS
ncbi:MAG: DNA ligase D [Burkholderiaceae bacterium]|nr:DNA ligase D [Burkholderiaceae bacterium]